MFSMRLTNRHEYSSYETLRSARSFVIFSHIRPAVLGLTWGRALLLENLG
jgi:hypothetical protein